MNSARRPASAFLGVAIVLAVALGLALLLVSPRPGPGPVPPAAPDGSSAAPPPAGGDPGVLAAKPASKEATPTSTRARDAGAFGPGSGVWSRRQPHGEDLSDPAVRLRLVREALASVPVDWGRMRQLLSPHVEPLPAGVRTQLVLALYEGPLRHQVAGALEVARDPALFEDLVAVLEDARAPAEVRSQAIRILARMPAVDANRAVEALSDQLTGEVVADAPLVQAIAERGGPAAMESLLSYLDDPATAAALSPRLLGAYDLTADSPSRAILSRALGEVGQPAERLRHLIALAGRPGAAELVPALIALQTDHPNQEIRRESLAALARTGEAGAVQHLLDTAASGAMQEEAAGALGTLASATPQAREVLRAQLAARTASERTIRMVLRTLGRVGGDEALPEIVAHLEAPAEAVQVDAIGALRALGPQARSAVEDLERALESGSPAVQQAAAVAMGEIGGPAACTVLAAWAGRKGVDPSLQQAVRSALRRATPARPR